MAEKLDPRQLVTFEELLHACLYEQEALRRVLVQKGVLTDEEVLGHPEKPGGNAAVAYLLNRWPLTGFPAWLLWMALHLFYLIGFRNRIFVMVNWAWDYFFYERAVRLIFSRTRSTASPSPSPPESKGSR